MAARRIERIPYDLRAVVAVVLLTIPYLFLGQVTIGPLWLSVPAKLACVAVLPAILFRTGIVTAPRFLRRRP